MFKQVVVKNQLVSQHSKTGIRVLLIGIAMLGLGSFAGCKLGIKEASMITYRDTVWSRRAYNLRYGNCQREYSNHFENGFRAGYTDMCNGGDGYVPALPPSEYRTPEYQSADGAKCVNSWFEGYPAGVAAAKKDKSGTYHDVLISRMIDSAISQSKTEPVLPGDVKVVSSNQSVAGPDENQTPDGTPLSFYPPAPRRSALSILSPTSDEAPPQAQAPGAMPPVEARTFFPTGHSAPPSKSAGNVTDEQYLDPADEAADHLEIPLLLPAEIAPADWNATDR